MKKHQRKHKRRSRKRSEKFGAALLLPEKKSTPVLPSVVLPF